MTFKVRSKHLLALALTATFATGATADDSAGWEIHLGAGQIFFGNDLDDTHVINLGLGYRFNPRWTVEFMANDYSTDVENTNLGVDGNQYRLDVQYHFNAEGKWRPFLVAGLGHQRLSLDIGPTSDETLGNYGIGLKRRLSPNWDFRTDVRGFYSFDDEYTDVGVHAGVSYLFGNRPARQAPAPTPAPVAAAVDADSDGDGVPDSRDACPNTPAGVAVDQRGCPLDSDGDGVPDYRDQCPNTPRQFRVDANGCPVELTQTVSIDLAVKFDNNSAEVKPEYRDDIRRVATFMNQHSSTRVTVEGHSDSRGALEYNKQLSQRRADAVRQVLINEFGIAANRVTAVGYGPERPIADNNTAEGREANRRVVAEISADVTSTERRN